MTAVAQTIVGLGIAVSFSFLGPKLRYRWITRGWMAAAGLLIGSVILGINSDAGVLANAAAGFLELGLLAAMLVVDRRRTRARKRREAEREAEDRVFAQIVARIDMDGEDR